MKRRPTLLAGLGMGAGLMYLFDPSAGRRRRALVRDQLTHAWHKTADGLDATARDFRNRLSGTAAAVRRRVRPDEADDPVLVERVRAAMGRVVSHPHAIHVAVRDGVVRLSGSILASEVKPLLAAVSWVQGVAEVDDQLERHEQAGDLPALQGGAVRPGWRAAWMQVNWSPTARLLAGAAGGALALYGVTRRNAAGAGLAILGTGLLVRGLTNLETARLLGVGVGRRAIDIQKTIEIGAPIDQVFDFWNAYEDFPKYTTNVIDVRPTRAEGQTHWTVRGMAGQNFEFDTVVTERLPNKLLAWKTAEGTAVSHAGIIRFDPTGEAATRVHIRVSYNPPGGALGHGMAATIGADLKSRLDEDLARIKTTLETGTPPHDAARPSQGEAPQIH